LRRFSRKVRARWRSLTEERRVKNLRSRRKRRLRTGALPAKDRRDSAGDVVRILAPEVFLLERGTDRARMVKFLAGIRDAVVVRKLKVRIDFSKVKRLHPCGVLLFTAEIERIRRYAKKDGIIRSNYPAERIVEQVFQHLGILSLLGRPARLEADSFEENVKHWRRAKGLVVEGQAFEQIQQSYEGRIADPLLSRMFGGVTEAMTNSVHHAYADQRGDGIANHAELREWWMFSEERDGRLNLAMCDVGIGIPRSLGKADDEDRFWIADWVRKLMAPGDSDSALISAAVNLRKSRTGRHHRGRGLGEIQAVVENAPNGFLKIHSNRGLYSYNATARREQRRDFRSSIMGTLVLWSVPIELPET
jgi:hypothetical protein